MKTCLIVDDSRVIRTVATKILTEFGFKTDTAENGEIALQKCLESMPDLVFLDWNMPVMNGMDFMLNLKQQHGNAPMPKIIFCTTENDMAHIVEAVENGADEYIMKPFDNEIVQSKLLQIGLL